MKDIRASCLAMTLLIVGSFCASSLGQAQPASSPSQMVIPFELKGYLILVKCRINDSPKEYNFIVDTGGLTCIDKPLADDLKLKQQGPQAKINRLIIAGYPFDDVFVSTMFPFQLLKTANGLTLSGIIGSDLLEDYLVTLDYEKKQLILSNSAESLAAEKEKAGQGYVLPFKIHPINHSPIITCRLNGTLQVEAMIDTGQPYPLVLPLDFLEKTGALSRKETIKAKGVMARWPMTQATDNYLSRVKSLEAGDLRMDNLLAFYAELPSLLAVPLLGKDFLAGFLVKINYPKNELWLIPRHGRPKLDTLFSCGLSLEQQGEDQVAVRGVWPRSPADQAGVEVGDRILEFNSKKADFASHQELWLLLQDENIKTVNLVIQKAGGPHKITLKKRNLLQ